MIKSTDAEVRGLIQALGASDDSQREAAVARLSIIGHRAVGRLVTEYDSVRDRVVQLAILQILEPTADSRAMPVAQQALAAGGDLAVAGVGVLRELLSHADAMLQARALDALLATARDSTLERRVRSAAAQALDTATEDVRRAVRAQLPRPEPADAALWEDAAEGHLPEDPRELRAAIAVHANSAALPVLRRLIEAVRERERQEQTESRREAWRKVRGALHQAVALRGSRVALYDLRETLEASAEPLPSSFLAALQVIGDESCLEPLATAYVRTPGQHARWRHQLVEALHAVARRERLTKRHSSLRRALAKLEKGDRHP